MEKDHISDLLPEYLDGRLDSHHEDLVVKHLQVCEKCKREKEELEILLSAFENEILAEPSSALRSGFERMLESEKLKSEIEEKVIPITRGKKSRLMPNILKVAAVVSLILCSYLLGKFHQADDLSNPVSSTSESDDLQKEMLALLDDISASKRIQGVSYFEDLPNLDEEIISALTDRMFNDENNNVRLTAAQALGKFTTSDAVKNNLIIALKSEKDPVIQIAIIQILVEIQEKKAVEPMQDLLKNKETEPFVKEQIKALLPSIT